jgi:hypothetical protein
MVKNDFKQPFELLFFVDPSVITTKKLIEVSGDCNLGPSVIIVSAFWKVVKCGF